MENTFNMQNLDDDFENLNWTLFRMLPELIETDRNGNSRVSVVIKFFFFLSLMLLFVGDEVTKLIFRRNFGKKGVHWWKIILSFAAFVGIGICALMIGLVALFHSDPHLNQSEIWNFYSKVSFVITGILNLGLAFYILINGFFRKKNIGVNKHYRGDSILLGYLITENKSQARVQNVDEPRTLLLAGIGLTLVNPLLGPPLVICALSSWLTHGYEVLRGVNNVRNMLAEHGYNMTKGNEFMVVRP